MRLPSLIELPDHFPKRTLPLALIVRLPEPLRVRASRELTFAFLPSRKCGLG